MVRLYRANGTEEVIDLADHAAIEGNDLVCYTESGEEVARFAKSLITAYVVGERRRRRQRKMAALKLREARLSTKSAR